MLEIGLHAQKQGAVGTACCPRPSLVEALSSSGDDRQCAVQAEQSEKVTLQQQLREARSAAAQAAAAAPAVAQQQQQLAEQTAAVARLEQQQAEAKVTGCKALASLDHRLTCFAACCLHALPDTRQLAGRLHF